jgi:hypothetical protein
VREGSDGPGVGVGAGTGMKPGGNGVPRRCLQRRHATGRGLQWTTFLCSAGPAPNAMAARTAAIMP